MRNAFFWVITQRGVVISYRSFGTTYRFNHQGQRICGYFLQTFLVNLYFHSWRVNNPWLLPTFRTTYRHQIQGLRICYFLPTFLNNLSVPSLGSIWLLPTFRGNLSAPNSGVKNLWLFVTDVSGEPIGPLFKGQESVVITDVSGQPIHPTFSGQESVVISYRRFWITYRPHL
jgi:hypothetical protein